MSGFKNVAKSYRNNYTKLKSITNLKVYFTLLILILSGNLYSQSTGEIKGVVLDSISAVPQEFVSIKLLRNDTVFVAGFYTDSLGKFQFNNLEFGTYSLKIDGLGYTSKMIAPVVVNEVKKVQNLGKIGITINRELSLEEVKIIAEQDLLKTGIDKKVYNLSEDLVAKNGNVSDVLNNIPSVQVDQDGNVVLRGDANVTILIDGRPSALVGNGKSLLDAIPASSIERIEIVTNPSAKYDPDGTSGIINIVLKKNKVKGINGKISASAGTGNLYNFNTAISYRNNKFNFYTTYALQYREGFRNNFGTIRQTFGDSISNLDQNRVGTDLQNSHTLLFGTDYYINSQNTIGFTVTGNYEQRDRTGVLANDLTTNNNQFLRKWDRTSLDPSLSKVVDFSGFYQKDFKEGKGSYSVSGNQSFGNEDTEGYYAEYYYDSLGQPTGQANLNQELYNTENNSITTVQTDYVRNTTKKGRIEIGAKAIVRDQLVNTYSQRRDTILGNYMSDTLANFDYEYNEQIYSIYGIYGHDFGKLKVQGGIRGENAYQIPNLISENKKFTNHYLNLFPSGHLKYQLRKELELGLSYSRRVNRASSYTLNPFTSYADPFNLRSGNPELQPEYINSLDLSTNFTKKDFTISTSVFYRKTTDVIQRIKVFYPNNTAAVTYKNIDESTSTGVEVVLIFKLKKIWKNTLSFNGTEISYRDNELLSQTNPGGFNYDLKYNSTIDFWKKTATFQLNARYSSPRATAQGTVQPRGSIDLALEKSLFKNNWSVGLRLTDIFNTQGFYYEVNIENAKQSSDFKWLTRRLIFSVSYKFGKLETSKNKSPNHGEGGMDF